MVVDASSCLRTGYAGIKFMYLEDSGRVKLLVMISAVNGSGGYLLGKGQWAFYLGGLAGTKETK